MSVLPKRRSTLLSTTKIYAGYNECFSRKSMWVIILFCLVTNIQSVSQRSSWRRRGDPRSRIHFYLTLIVKLVWPTLIISQLVSNCEFWRVLIQLSKLELRLIFHKRNCAQELDSSQSKIFALELDSSNYKIWNGVIHLPTSGCYSLELDNSQWISMVEIR